MDSKQVIVIRKVLKMRKGKMVSQGAHAAMKVILDQMHEIAYSDVDVNFTAQFLFDLVYLIKKCTLSFLLLLLFGVVFVSRLLLLSRIKLLQLLLFCY